MDDKDITEALNKEGFLFQEAIADIIERIFPGTEKDVPLSMYFKHLMHEEESSIDIRTNKNISHNSNVHSIHFIIECKKSYNSVWAFFRSTSNKNKTENMRFNSYLYHPSTIGSHGSSSFSNLRLDDIKVNPPHHEICTKALEVSKKRDGWVAKGDNILKGVKQLSFALKYTIQEIDTYHETMIAYQNNSIREHFIQLLITNAPLKICEFKIKDIDINKGNISKDHINYTSRDWLILKNQVPAHLRIDKFDEMEDIADYHSLMKTASTSFIIVVNSNRLLDFLKLLNKDLDDELSKKQIL